MTSAVAPKTSAVSTQPSSENTDPKIMALKESSKQFLGCGYDRRAGDQKKVTMPVMDITDSDIRVTNYVTRTVVEIGVDEGIVSDQVKRRIGLNIEFSGILKGEIKSVSANKTKVETATHVCAVGYFESMHCALTKYLPIKNNVNKGDACVVSGRLYIGFCVFFTVETEKTQHNKDKELTGAISLSFKKWLINLGLEADQVDNKLEKRVIKRITIHAEGYGYSPNIPVQEINKDFERILESINDVKTDFTKASAKIQMCPYSINPNEDICSYRQIEFIANTPPISLEIRLPERSLIATDGSAHVFRKLASDILRSCDPSRKIDLESVLQNARLEQMLEEMFVVFSETGIAKPTESKSTPNTMVIGAIGAGKSLLTGHLLGHPIIKTVIPSRGGRTRELLCLAEGPGIPVVGHNLAQTRGCRVYENYIDTAGFFETGSGEREICNAAAIYIMTQLCNPTRLICVIESGSFSSRAERFFDILDKLKQAIRFPTSGVIPPSILFVIRETTDGECWKLIYEAIDRLDGALKSGVWQAVKQTVAGYLFNIDSDEGYDERGLIKDRLSMLEQLTEQNVVVANYNNDEMKERIQQWQRVEMGNISSSFDMEKLVPGGFGKFKEVLCVAVAYFKNTYVHLQHFKSHISTLNASLQDKKALKLELVKAIDNETIVDIIGKAQNRRHEELETLRAQKLKLEKEKTALRLEREDLENDETETFLRNLTPDQPIRARIVLFREKSYRFNYKGIPLLRTKKQNEIGSFFNEKHDPNSEGKYSYSIEYKPSFGWFGSERGEAVIELYVKKKDHPETFIEIDGQLEEINEQLKNVEEEIRQLSATLAGGKDDVISSLDKEILEINKTLSIHAKACEETQTVLDENKSFLKIIYKIIQSSRRIRWTDTQISNFNFFLEHFHEYLGFN